MVFLFLFLFLFFLQVFVCMFLYMYDVFVFSRFRSVLFISSSCDKSFLFAILFFSVFYCCIPNPRFYVDFMALKG